MIVLGNAVPIVLDAVPSMAGKRVLDVGCMAGDNLAHPAYAPAKERHGVDVDAAAIKRGRVKHTTVMLWQAPAEDLPFGAGYFDVVISNVALPYTDIRRALEEIRRVLKPGGELFLTMHDWRHQLSWFGKSSWKRKADYAYICLASLIYLTVGYVIPRPNGTRETFQTERSLKRDLATTGFESVSFRRTERDWIITARKAS